MGRPAIKWGMVARYFSRRGYTLVGDGGDILIHAPSNGSGPRAQVRIGHRFSNHTGAQLQGAHLQLIKRSFNVSWEDIYND